MQARAHHRHVRRARSLHVAGATEAARLANGARRLGARAARRACTRTSRTFYDSRDGQARRHLHRRRRKSHRKPEAPKPVAAVKAPSPNATSLLPRPRRRARSSPRSRIPNEPVDLTGARLRHRQRRHLRGRRHRQQRDVERRGAQSQRRHRRRSGRYRHQGGPDRASVGARSISARIGCGRSAIGTALFPPKPTPSRSTSSACPSWSPLERTARRKDVKVMNDPGHGFGRAARQCAHAPELRTRRSIARESGRVSSLAIAVTFRR